MLTGKKEKNMIAEQEKANAEKIAKLEESLKKKKQVKSISMIAPQALSYA